MTLLVVTLVTDLSLCKKEYRNPFPQFRQKEREDFVLKRSDRFRSLLQDEQLSPEQALKRDPHHYRPLPLPLRDAMRYVKVYGKHADMLKQLDSISVTNELERKLYQFKSSKMQCKRTPRIKG